MTRYLLSMTSHSIAHSLIRGKYSLQVFFADHSPKSAKQLRQQNHLTPPIEYTYPITPPKLSIPPAIHIPHRSYGLSERGPSDPRCRNGIFIEKQVAMFFMNIENKDTRLYFIYFCIYSFAEPRIKSEIKRRVRAGCRRGCRDMVGELGSTGKRVCTPLRMSDEWKRRKL